MESSGTLKIRCSGLALGCALLIASGALLQTSGDIRVVPLVRDGQVLVSFELSEGLSEDVREAIRSGLRTTIVYTIDLRVEVPAWIDRTIASSVVGTTVQYDNLTRRHSVSRTVDGRVEEARVTEDESLVRQWMTSLHQLPLFRTATLEPNREYYVRVRARTRPRTANLFWPWGGDPSGQVKFTFLP